MCHTAYSTPVDDSKHPLHGILTLPLVAPASRRWGLLGHWQPPPDSRRTSLAQDPREPSTSGDAPPTPWPQRLRRRAPPGALTRVPLLGGGVRAALHLARAALRVARALAVAAAKGAYGIAPLRVAGFAAEVYVLGSVAASGLALSSGAAGEALQALWRALLAAPATGLSGAAARAWESLLQGLVHAGLLVSMRAATWVALALLPGTGKAPAGTLPERVRALVRPGGLGGTGDDGPPPPGPRWGGALEPRMLRMAAMVVALHVGAPVVVGAAGAAGSVAEAFLRGAVAGLQHSTGNLVGAAAWAGAGVGIGAGKRGAGDGGLRLSRGARFALAPPGAARRPAVPVVRS